MWWIVFFLIFILEERKLIVSVFILACLVEAYSIYLDFSIKKYQSEVHSNALEQILETGNYQVNLIKKMEGYNAKF